MSCGSRNLDLETTGVQYRTSRSRKNGSYVVRDGWRVRECKMSLAAVHDQFIYLLLEIEACRKAREHRKAVEERKKTVIVGDLRPLFSALLDINFSTSCTNDKIKK